MAVHDAISAFMWETLLTSALQHGQAVYGEPRQETQAMQHGIAIHAAMEAELVQRIELPVESKEVSSYQTCQMKSFLGTSTSFLISLPVFSNLFLGNQSWIMLS
jgi:hypothetical protein